jgi:hypothetical protein
VVADTISTKIIDNSIPVPAVLILNLEVGLAGKITDKLLTDELRKVGWKDKLRRKREDTDEQHDLAQQIKSLARVTSGVLLLSTIIALIRTFTKRYEKESLQERKRIRSVIAIVPQRQE